MRHCIDSILRRDRLALALAAVHVLAACSEDGSPSPSSETAGTLAVASGGATAPATASAGVAAEMSAGSSASSAGAAGSSAAPAAGTAGVSNSAGAGAGGTAGAAIAAGSGGSTVAGAGGAGVGGAGNAGADAATGCTRELLKSTVDACFRALAAHDPSSLPLADDVKLTENGKALELGEGLWKSAGMVKHTQSALDTERCSSATQAVVPEGALDLPVALRLALAGGRITEIELIAVRPGDYEVLGSAFASNPGAIITADASVQWEKSVPAEQRNTREEIAGWIDKYFRIFPRGVCNVTSDCKRLENGGGSFACSFGASCAAGPPGAGQAALEPRLILVDVETGIGVGFTMFMGNTDMHMYKMYGDQVHAVHAILGAASSAGWD